MSQTNHPYEQEGSSALKQAAGTAAKKAGKYAAKKAVKKAVATKAGAVGLPYILAAIAALLIVVVLAVGILVVVVSSVKEEETAESGAGLGFWGGDISAIGENEIPAAFIPVYKAAQEKYGVPWNLLAAHHRVETRFSTISPMISPVGATGHMQFMPCTWVGWGHPSCSGLGAGNIPASQVTDLATIKKYGGYGVDGDGDGKADPNNLKDAIFGAANYLAASGAAEGRIRDAVFAYNHADWYVEEVMGYADSYVNGYVAIGGGTGGNTDVVNVGKKYIGNSVYVFGGGRNQSDIARGRFDCSSFVHWAYKQVGVDLGPLGSTSTETLKHLGKPVKPSEMKPGDLVFFDTYKIDGHVGIYVGNNKFIGAQSSTGVAIADMSPGSHWAKVFNGRVKRI